MSLETNRIRYQRLKEQGLCTKCGKHPAIQNETLCTECKQKNKDRASIRRENGLCPICGNPSADGFMLCETHLQCEKESRQWFLDHKICSRCRKNKVSPGRKTCDDCLDKQRKRRKELRAERTQEQIDAAKLYRKRYKQERIKSGVCYRCGKPLFENHTVCYEHYISEKKRWTKRSWQKNHHYRELGLCMWCGAERKKGYLFCPTCYEKKKAQALRMVASDGWRENQEKQREYIHYKYFAAR